MYHNFNSKTILAYEYFVYLSAKRTSKIDMGAPWGEITAERNMPNMKFYHDFSAGECTHARRRFCYFVPFLTS